MALSPPRRHDDRAPADAAYITPGAAASPPDLRPDVRHPRGSGDRALGGNDILGVRRCDPQDDLDAANDIIERDRGHLDTGEAGGLLREIAHMQKAAAHRQPAPRDKVHQPEEATIAYKAAG